MFRKILYVICAAVALCFLFRNLSATPVGKSVQLLRERELSVELYVVTVHSIFTELRGAELVWVPDYAAKQCLGKSYQECQRLSSEEGLKGKRALKKECPTQILSTWVSLGDIGVFPENKKILERLSRVPFIRKAIEQHEGQYSLGEISADKKIRAIVRWQLWQNGEHFRVIKVLH